MSRIMHKYWDMTDGLISDNGTLPTDSRVIITLALRESFLSDLHQEYEGSTKCHITAIILIY